MRIALGALVTLLLVGPASAADLPNGRFQSMKIEAALNRVAEGCKSRGLEIRSADLISVTCTAASIPNTETGDLRAEEPQGRGVRVNIKFQARPAGDDVTMTASMTHELPTLRGPPRTMNADGFGFHRYRSQIRSFLTSIGAVQVR